MSSKKEELIRLYKDLDRWAYPKKIPFIFTWIVIFIYPATWAVVIYRFGRIVSQIQLAPLRIILKVFYFILKRFVAETYLSTDISEGADISGGFHIAHLGGIVIGKGVIAGKNFSIRQGVTCGGTRKQGTNHPRFGNNVAIAAGAVVVGNVLVGDGVMIAGNSVVIKDVKNNATVAGIPARIIDEIGSLDYGMKNIRNVK